MLDAAVLYHTEGMCAVVWPANGQFSAAAVSKTNQALVEKLSGAG
jgi:hypothetical protein